MSFATGKFDAQSHLKSRVNLASLVIIILYVPLILARKCIQCPKELEGYNEYALGPVPFVGSWFCEDCADRGGQSVGEARCQINGVFTYNSCGYYMDTGKAYAYHAWDGGRTELAPHCIQGPGLWCCPDQATVLENATPGGLIVCKDEEETCPVGEELVENCGCVEPCPQGQTRSSDCQCRCPQEGQILTSNCGCQKPCSDVSEVFNNKCLCGTRCPAGFNWFGLDKICRENCQPGYVYGDDLRTCVPACDLTKNDKTPECGCTPKCGVSEVRNSACKCVADLFKRTCDAIESPDGEKVGLVLDQASFGLDLYCGKIPDVRKYADVALSILGAAVDAFNAGGAPPGQLYDTLMLAAKTIGPELAALARFAFKQTNPIFAICKAQLAAKLANLGWGLAVAKCSTTPHKRNLDFMDELRLITRDEIGSFKRAGSNVCTDLLAAIPPDVCKLAQCGTSIKRETLINAGLTNEQADALEETCQAAASVKEDFDALCRLRTLAEQAQPICAYLAGDNPPVETQAARRKREREAKRKIVFEHSDQW